MVSFSFISLATISLAAAAYASSDFTIRQIGAPNTLEYEVYFEKDGEVISPFHDIPLFANDEKTLYNMIVEIPKWTNAKNEINKETALNPIKQDVSDGKPRFVPNVFPFKGYMWNYGAFPQTWENPSIISEHTQKGGDNDPIDILEIGDKVAKVGDVKAVKILGIIGLLDQDETDWKVVVIDSTDPLAEQMNDIGDVEKYMPGLLSSTDTFLRTYKLPSGKAANTIAFDGEAQDKAFATNIVLETHEYWKALVNGTADRKDIQTSNLSVEDSPYKIESNNNTVSRIPEENALPAAAIDPSTDKWHYVSI